jgi:hypothetical protein
MSHFIEDDLIEALDCVADPFCNGATQSTARLNKLANQTKAKTKSQLILKHRVR